MTKINNNNILPELSILNDGKNNWKSDQHYHLAEHFSALNLSDEAKIEQIALHFGAIMELLGLDTSEHSLQATPQRVAKMYVKDIFAGLNEDNFPKIELFVNDASAESFKVSQQQTLFSKVNFISFCEHHFVPMIGCAYVAYVPHKKLIGLSKIPQIVRYFAARPQLQERLTGEIANCFSSLLETEHVAVSLKANHCCVMVQDMHAGQHQTITNVLCGDFHHNSNLRQEFLTLINSN